MLKNNVFFFLLAFLMIGSLEAQVRPGIKTGFNLTGVSADYIGTSTLSGDKAGDPDNFHMKGGFQIGMVVDWTINEWFTIQPGARFTMQGFKDEYQNNGNFLRKFSLYYFQVPIYAQYKYNLGHVNLIGQAGPYLGYGLFGRQKYSKNSQSKSLDDSYKKIDFGNGSGDDIHNAFDYGVGVGVGAEFGALQLMVAYEFGLYKATFDKKAYSGDYKLHMQNNGLSITLAFIFGKKFPRFDPEF